MARVLIVDDSATEVQALTNILEGAGHEAIAARNAEEGLAMARTELPDLVLMDIVMPGLNGFQATRQLSRDATTKDIPVIVVSTKDGDTDKVWGKRQGAADYLVKPVDGDALLQAVNAALG